MSSSTPITSIERLLRHGSEIQLQAPNTLYHFSLLLVCSTHVEWYHLDLLRIGQELIKIVDALLVRLYELHFSRFVFPCFDKVKNNDWCAVPTE